MQKEGRMWQKQKGWLWVAAFAGIMATGWIVTPQEPFGCCQADVSSVPDASFAQSVEVTAKTEPEKEDEPKIVCLTFDDGPSKNTPEVLSILKQEDVPATFFVVAAENNEKHLPLIQQEVQNGHQVALHSATHEYKKIYASTQAFWDDIEQLKQKIGPYVDVQAIHYLRFPGGSTNTVSHKYGGASIMKNLKEQAETKGYHWIDWNVCAGDAVGGHPSAEKIFNNVKKEADGKAVCVVLMHDTAVTKNTVEALPRIIEWFKQQGYQFCTIEQMKTLTQ